MYSIVMMMALTSAPETPNCGWKHGCYASCYGCYGGYGYGGYGGYGYGYACSGCAGNVTFYRSCYGYAPNYYTTPFSCFGYGVYGGSSYYYPYTADPNMTGGYGYGYPVPPNPPNAVPRVDDTKKPDTKKDDVKPLPKVLYQPVPGNRAQVVVRLPADAKLFANNQPTNLDSSEQAFNTPALTPGFDYQYEMKVEYTRDGKTITDKQVVKVRAGAVSRVEFADRAKSATVSSTIKFVAPAGAKLFVDGKPLALPDNAPAYQTPELVRGAEYVYTVRAELDKDGKNRTQTQRVVFKAGEAVTVDFMDLGSIRTAAK